jgi:hypothetical protein
MRRRRSRNNETCFRSRWNNFSFVSRDLRWSPRDLRPPSSLEPARLRTRMPSHMRVTDEIHKPERDDRLYRRVTFPNGLEALLISDPSLVRSRAAAAVARTRTHRTAPTPRLCPSLTTRTIRLRCFLTSTPLHTRSAGWHADPRRRSRRWQ